MGVAGFTPFLQKICPTVLKQLPNRLKALEGKRIVIDGTLITQRFHFGSDPHPHHHVWGWYWLAHELKKNNITAVCVFDGKDRSAAKKDELKRRREARKLTLSRGSIEDARFQRLHDLKGGMDQLHKLDDVARQEVVKILKESDFTAGDTSTAVLDQEVIAKDTVGTEPPTTEIVKDLEYEPSIVHPDAEPKAESPSPRTPTTTDPAQLANLLKSLHLSYQAGMAKLATISTDAVSQQLDAMKPTEEEPSEKSMTKQQHELTLQEGKLWEALSSSLDKPHFEVPVSANEKVGSLLDKSHAMAASFQKRNNAPTAKTYSDSKAILKAMGIPCVDADGAVEAEALASSMVLAGLADYVVSEDTDVLVYEAPLIRNITAFTEPLLAISGSDVRSELELTRDAYIDFVLLLGTDFSQRIKNVGPMRAYDLIKKHGSIEGVLDDIADNPKYTLKVSPDAYMAQVQIARLVFATLPAVPPPELMQPLEQDDAEVERLLREYNLERGLLEDVPYETALVGNHFGDNPYAL